MAMQTTQAIPLKRAVVISPARAARIMACSPSTVLRYLEEGRLEGYRLRPGGWWRVNFESVIRFMQRRKDAAPDQ